MHLPNCAMYTYLPNINLSKSCAYFLFVCFVTLAIIMHISPEKDF